MKFGSLFSGIGGFDLGFERAGMQCAWQVEIDEPCCAVLNKHWPHVARYSDVRRVENLEPVDLICGGFPCQDLSVAGKRRGLAGERSGLWFEFHRVLGEVRPGWVVVENVPGLLSSNGGRDFAVLLRGLVELGYGVAWRILDAQYFGVAQRRRRVFIVGHLGDGRAAEVLFESEGGCWHPAPSREKREGTARNAAFSPFSHYGYERAEQAATIHNPRQFSGSENLVTTGFTHSGYSNKPAWITGQRVDTIGPCQHPSSHQGVGLIESMITHAVAIPYTIHGFQSTAMTGGGDGSHTGALSSTAGMKQQNYIAWHENKQGNLTPDPDGIAKALRSGASHSYQGIGVRRLTPTECERLQGFPGDWTAGQSDTARYRQLGNAVAVPVAEWLGRRILLP